MKTPLRSIFDSRGALSIEATIVLPMLLWLMLLGILSIEAEAAYDRFEAQVHSLLIRSIHTTVETEALLGAAEGIPRLSVEDVRWSGGCVTVRLCYAGRLRREWVIRYPFARIPWQRLVYVTDTGIRYHHPGCRHVRRSLIPFLLSETPGRYTPCKVCGW